MWTRRCWHCPTCIDIGHTITPLLDRQWRPRGPTGEMEDSQGELRKAIVAEARPLDTVRFSEHHGRSCEPQYGHDKVFQARVPRTEFSTALRASQLGHRASAPCLRFCTSRSGGVSGAVRFGVTRAKTVDAVPKSVHTPSLALEFFPFLRVLGNAHSARPVTYGTLGV